ncbi:MAG: hypothetical protein SOW59_06745 [Corynebacterium sp.]|nr:hypothetical protein [Corynebacterium sp.]
MLVVALILAFIAFVAFVFFIASGSAIALWALFPASALGLIFLIVDTRNKRTHEHQ